jgi:ATP phosphoribosyltransferase
LLPKGHYLRNRYVEKEEDAVIIKRLGFSKCRLSLAIPKDIDYPGLQWFDNKKIATSYPVILKKHMQANGIKAEVHVITGSVEVAPGIGLADAIFGPKPFLPWSPTFFARSTSGSSTRCRNFSAFFL